MENYILPLVVKVDEVDIYNRMKIEALLIHFQEVATIHAEILGNGRYDLEKNNAFWVLSRISLKVNQLPKLKQEINLKTWPNDRLKFMFPRNYVITNKEGETLVESSSIWMVMNSNTRKVEVNPNYVIFNCKLDKAKELSANKVTFDENKKFDSVEHKIVYSEYLKNHLVTEVDINYLHELTYKNHLRLDYYFNENEFVVKGVSNEIDCFMIKVKLEEIL